MAPPQLFPSWRATHASAGKQSGLLGEVPEAPASARWNGGFLASARILPESRLMAVSLVPCVWHGSEAVDVAHGHVVYPTLPLMS